MIAQAYCGGTHFHGGLRCNTTDGACPKCLRSHIARLEAHARELDGELSVARMAATECESACRELGEGFAAVSEEELVALRCLDDAVTINGDGMSTEALGVDWEVARSAKRRLVNIRAAKGGG